MNIQQAWYKDGSFNYEQFLNWVHEHAYSSYFSTNFDIDTGMRVSVHRGFKIDESGGFTLFRENDMPVAHVNNNLESVFGVSIHPAKKLTPVVTLRNPDNGDTFRSSSVGGADSPDVILDGNKVYPITNRWSYYQRQEVMFRLEDNMRVTHPYVYSPAWTYVTEDNRAMFNKVRTRVRKCVSTLDHINYEWAVKKAYRFTYGDAYTLEQMAALTEEDIIAHLMVTDPDEYSNQDVFVKVLANAGRVEALELLGTRNKVTALEVV